VSSLHAGRGLEANQLNHHINHFYRQMSSILSEDRRARRRGNANAISNASGSDANQMHESSEEDEEMSEDDEFLDANESPTSENDDEWSDVESGDENPKEPSPVDLETRQQELRQRIFAIQADTNLSSAEKSQQIQQLMSNKCQQLNKNPKSPKNGQAADLQPGEAGEEDKTVLWHVCVAYLLPSLTRGRIRMKTLWDASITAEMPNCKRIAATSGWDVAFVTTRLQTMR